MKFDEMDSFPKLVFGYDIPRKITICLVKIENGNLYVTYEDTSYIAPESATVVGV